MAQPQTVGNVLDSYLDYAKANLRTWHKIEQCFCYFSEIADREATSITTSEVESMRRSVIARLTPKTANKITAQLSTAYNHSIRLGLIPDYNPVRMLTKLDVVPRNRELTPDELPQFFKALSLLRNELLRDFFLVCLFTGEIRSYVINMSWEDIDLERGAWFIKQRKRQPRVVYPPREVMDILNRRMKDSNSPWVFASNSQSGHLEGTDKSWARLIKRSGLKGLRLNDLRLASRNIEPLRLAMAQYYYVAPKPETKAKAARANTKTDWNESVREAISKPIIRSAIPPRLKLTPYSLDSTTPSFGDIFEYYMEHHGNRRKSAKAMRRYFERYLTCFAKRPADKITTVDVLQLHKYIGEHISPTTANRALEVVGAVFNKAIRWQLIDIRNPALAVERFKTESRDRFLSADENERLAQALSTNRSESFQALIQTLRFTGARSGNVAAMRWCDLDLEAKIWRIPMTKNGKPHILPLLHEALEAIKSQHGKHPVWVFPSNSRKGHVTSPGNSWRRLASKAGLSNARIHDLRRTMGSWQAKTGASLPIISKTLGHSNPSATAVYARLDVEPIRQAMEKAANAFQGKIEPQVPSAGVLDAEQLSSLADVLADAVADRLKQSQADEANDHDVVRMDAYRKELK